MTGRTVIHLVPHTHWDREWYLPFQTFRARLVGLIDGLLDEMDADPSVRFTLDGQTATIDDYLEIRPEAVDRVARLVGEGRLAVGPWAILMDEFLVSGETIVRNLELGVRRAAELGRVMPVGYLPDMFGHVAQMPQILVRAGIVDAVVWRGVPTVIDRHVFGWRSPDGSEVRCEYLVGGYDQAADLFDLDDRIERKLDVHLARMRPWFGESEILAMYGEDHSLPRPGYAAAIADVNARQDRFDVRIETLGEYIEQTRELARPKRTWTGELRSSARANVLMGVASHRTEVKQAAGRAERWLERRAEPLLALHGRSSMARSLELAWRRVIENSAHDSICACSSEDTVQQVMSRYAEAEQIGRALVGEALDRIGGQAPTGSWVVWNPSPHDRSGLVEITIPADALDGITAGGDTSVAVQELGVEQAILDDRSMPAREIVPYLRNRLHGRELYGYLVNGLALGRGTGITTATVSVDVSKVADSVALDIDALLDELDGTADEADAAVPGVTWRLLVAARPQRRLLVDVPVPGLGWTTVAAAAESARRIQARVTVDDRRLTNGKVSVAVRDDGTLTIEGPDGALTGVGRIVDGGDAGDSYNYAPPLRDTVIRDPISCEVTTIEAGPLRGILAVSRTYRWPAGLADDNTSWTGSISPTVVRMSVELRAGESFVRLRVDFDNQSTDHRVRFHIPLPRSVDRSFAEGQYAIVERGLTMEGGHGEHPLPTFPAHGLVGADGVVVLLDHLVEYELADGQELALTLLRATGLISRAAHPWRTEPAGPVIEAPTGQGIGRRSTTFAILPQAGPPGAAALAALDRYRSEFLAVRATGPAGAPLIAHPGLVIHGEGIVLTTLRRRDGAIELRLVNESDTTQVARIDGSFTAVEPLDLLGRPAGAVAPAAGTLERQLGPWEICTVALRS